MKRLSAVSYQLSASTVALLFVISCEPPREPSSVYARVASECRITYVAPQSGAELTLAAKDELSNAFDLRAMCFRLDGANVLLVDGVAGKATTHGIFVAPGAHKLTAYGVWTSGTAGHFYTYVVKSSHPIDAAQAHVVKLTFYEAVHDGPLQDRPKARWSDE